MTVFSRPGHRVYRFNPITGSWQSRRQKADGTGLAKEWGWTRWLAGMDEATGLGTLQENGFKAVLPV